MRATRPTRIVLMLTCLAALSACAGCAQGRVDAAQQPAAKAGPGAAPRERRAARTPIVRELLGTLEQVEVESDADREPLRQMLYDADGELHRVLGKNSRRAIMEANERLPAKVMSPY